MVQLNKLVVIYNIIDRNAVSNVWNDIKFIDVEGSSHATIGLFALELPLSVVTWSSYRVYRMYWFEV